MKLGNYNVVKLDMNEFLKSKRAMIKKQLLERVVEFTSGSINLKKHYELRVCICSATLSHKKLLGDLKLLLI
jgi:hypothetical protein